MTNAQRKAIADAYFNGLIAADLSAVPYHDQVIFRTPLAEGGSESPITGKAAVLGFFSGVYGALESVSVSDYFYNEEGTGVTVKADFVLKSGRSLRVLDLFRFDADGRIIEQENHYDPRPAFG
jgi:hypothetical protein